VGVDKRKVLVIQELQGKTLKWYESRPPISASLSIEERNSRLETLQEGGRTVAESILLKPKKKLSPGRYFFEAFPPPLRLL
jgi:hypothetical protein